MERSEQELVRIKKMNDLKEKGIDPFGKAFDQKHHSQELKDLYQGLDKEEIEQRQIAVSVAGRIMTKRRMGKLGFMHIQDRDGQIQIVVNKNVVGEETYELFKASDIGDIVGIHGLVYKTDSGELSVLANDYIHLTKALRPLPEKFHGLTDVEERYRRRYVDLIMNEQSKYIALTRPKIIRSIQRFLDNEGLVEVETPILQTILGGAAARPFVTHHNTLDIDMYLRIATELSLKRLIVGGLEGVYEIGRLFRNEGMDPKHNPEFTTVEAYVAYSDMAGMMDLCERLFETVSLEILGTNEVKINDDITVSLKAPYKRLNMCDAVNEKTGKDFRNISLEEALDVCKSYDIEILPHEKDLGHVINKLFEELCEEDLIEPTFVYGHPIEISPLAKKSADPRFTERFELYINKTEYGNAFSELNDPIDQKERFENQLKLKALGDEEASEMDTDYVEALEYGLPPTGGIGIGIDRFIMLLLQAESIRDVLLFPTMKTIKTPQEQAEGQASDKAVKSVDTSDPKMPLFDVNVPDYEHLNIEPLFEEFVDFETFSKSDFRAVKVKDCVAVPKSKKLLQFTLDDGSGTDRTILSGIHAYYEPEQLIGKTCIAIVNLPPRKMMGIDSCGMLISAVHQEGEEEKLHLLMVDPSIPAGAKLY